MDNLAILGNVRFYSNVGRKKYWMEIFMSVRKKRRKRRISRKTELRIKISSFIIICLAGVGVGIWFFTSSTIYSLAAVTRISLVGYDSKGYVKAEIDDSSLTEEEQALKEVLDTVEIDFSKEDNLSNGEKVEILYSYDKALAEQLGVKISDAKTTFTVESLPQAEVITYEQLFADVEVQLEGTSPALTAQVVNNSEHPYIRTMEFSIRNPKELYQKGDVIVVDAVFDEQEAIDYRYKVDTGMNGYSKEYPIENIDSYLMDYEKITDEMLDTLIQAGTGCFTDANEYGLRIFSEADCMPIWINKKTTFEWKNPYVISAYFNMAKENAMATAGEYINDIKIVYGVTLMQADGVNCDAEIVVRFNGIMEKADGSIDLAIDSGSMISASHKDKFIKNIVRNKDNEENYESVKILE